MSVSAARGCLAEEGGRLSSLHYLLGQAWTRFEAGTWAHDAFYAAQMAVEEIGWGEGVEADKWLGELEGLVFD